MGLPVAADSSSLFLKASLCKRVTRFLTARGVRLPPTRVSERLQRPPLAKPASLREQCPKYASINCSVSDISSSAKGWKGVAAFASPGDSNGSQKHIFPRLKRVRNALYLRHQIPSGSIDKARERALVACLKDHLNYQPWSASNNFNELYRFFGQFAHLGHRRRH